MMQTIVGWIGAFVGLVILTPVLVTAALFWIVSASTRAFARLVEPAYLTRDQLIQFDPIFGWKPRPNLHTYHLMGDLFRISTDGQGWRGRTTLEESDIVVFGDSFAAGYGVSDEQVFADLNAGLRIKPVGIGGYSMVQALLWMEELAHTLRGKLVVWFVYLGNDLYDNLSPELRGYRKPFVREVRPTGGWEIVSSHVTDQPWPIVARARKGDIHQATLAELCSDTFLAQRAYGACEFLIRRAQQVCAEVDAHLVVFTIPDTHQLSHDGHTCLRALSPELKDFDADAPDRRIAAICKTIDVPLVVGKGFLDVSCYKTNDCHWNELGHRRVAAKLAELHTSRKSRVAREAALPSHTTASRRELRPVAKSAT